MKNEPFIFDGRISPHLGVVNSGSEPKRIHVAIASPRSPSGIQIVDFVVGPGDGVLIKTGGWPVLLCRGDRIIPRMDGTYRVERAPIVVQFVDDGTASRRGKVQIEGVFYVRTDVDPPTMTVEWTEVRFSPSNEPLAGLDLEQLRGELIKAATRRIERNARERLRDVSKGFLPDDLPSEMRRL